MQTTGATVPSATSAHDVSNTSMSTSGSDMVDLISNVPSPVPLRRTSRVHKPPSYLHSYQCNTSGHWCNLVQHSSPAPSCTLVEPKSYDEAANNPLWVEAIQTELAALYKNNTWEVVSLPPGKKAIGSRWVFKVKLKADGSLERCKARLVAKGYNQKFGIDFEETFSPVVKMGTIRMLLALAATHHWSVYQLDMNNAFLYGNLDEEVYMQMPEGIPNPNNLVCLLKKSIYGLRQASRVWNAKLVVELLSQGFVQSKNDYILFIKHNQDKICVVAVYVDDVILTGTDHEAIASLKAHLDYMFSIKDLGKLHYFLGLEIDYLDSSFLLTQRKFAKELILSSGLDVSKSVATPLLVHLKLSLLEGDLLFNPELYRFLVGKLKYLTNTRPDLSYIVQSLNQFMHAPRTSHWSSLHHTLKYVAATINQGILLNSSDNLKLQAFFDADWASCPDSRRSITGYIFFGNSPLIFKFKKQHTVFKSSSEVEYRAMDSASSEVTWVVRLLEDLGITNLKPVILHCDNQSALYIAKNPVFMREPNT